MSENKDETKTKELRKVVVSITDSSGTAMETYRIIVPSDSTTEKEMEWRLDFLKGFATWGIESDHFMRKV